jgi:hypothetical protein
MLLDIGLGDDLLSVTTKPQTMKAKNKWDYIKSKMLLCRKQSIK